MRVLYCLVILVGFTAWSCGNENSPQTDDGKISGEKIFKTHCAICHGEDGRKGFADAKNLPESTLSMEERILIIANGKNSMMPYSGVLSEEEIQAVAKYTLSLK